MTIRSGLAWRIALAILGLMTAMASSANAQSAAYTITNPSPGLTSGGNFYMPSSQPCLSQWCAASSPLGAITCKAGNVFGVTTQYSVDCPTSQKWGCVTTAGGGSYCQVDVTPQDSSCYQNVDPYKCGALLAVGTVSCAGVQQCSGYVGNCPSGQTDAAGNCVKKPGDPQSGIPGPPLHDECDKPGMCVPNASKMLTSLKLNDTPLTYQPPFGPWLALRLTYNHLDNTQPAAPNYFNFGPQWTARFLTFVQDDPATGQQGKNVLRYVSGGGAVDYNYEAGAFNTTTGAWAGEIVGAGVLKRIPASGAVTSYTFTLPDGTVQTFAKLDGASTWPRRVFLTQVTDPQGNTLTLNYDATLRLTTLTDASGRATTLSYTNANPKLVTRITDPFGRHADFTYDGAGRLASITDAVGITSSFAWDDASGGDPTFIKTLTTPYGGGSFHGGRDVTANTRWLELTDALGQTERLEYLPSGAPGIAANETTAPTGMNTENGQYDKTNSFFWDKHSYPLYGTGPGRDYTKAEITHWALNGKGYASPVTASVKPPLENRVYYSYPGQAGTARFVGTLDMPTATGRVLDDATSSVTKATYNALGYPLTTTDAMGRAMRYTYAANNIDVTLVERKTTASVYTTVASFGGYTTKHEPQSYTDAAGKVWNIAYNAAGQTIYATDPLNETRFWEYDSYGRVTRVTVPTVVAFASVVYGTTNTSVPTATSYTYDAFDRVRTRTDSAGYVLTYDYDALDHVTRITYPDGSHDDSDYTFQSGPNIGQPSLDVRKLTDRLGRVTTYTYDANRRLTSVTEPLTSLPPATRTTSYSYYENGALKDQTDANGNVTHYAIDLQGRPTSKTYAYGTAGAKTETTAYENTTSRRKSLTDALAQVKTFAYALDNRITGIAYTNAVNPTPNVSVAWDSYFRRPTSITDGTGTTNFTYIAAGTNGALQLASIDNASYANDTITNSYDALGRVSARTINGGNEAFTYDTLGRMQTHATGLGTFTYGYLGQTGQLTSRSLNGTSIASAWAYDTNTADRRLTTITNSGATRSYGLSFIIPGGGGASSPYDIYGITDTAAATHPWTSQTHGYSYDQADRLLTASQPIPGNNTFVYDKLDNATTVTTPGSGTVNPTYNSMNQIVAWAANAYTYDSNGNTLSGDGAKTYKWDAENRLKEINYVSTGNKTVFTYDAFGHRILTAETVGGTTTTTRNLWCGDKVCQTRTSADVATRRHYVEGEHNIASGQKLVYMQDQLGSVRDVLDATTSALVASYDYGPYGNITRSWGTANTDYRYAGLFYHQNSGLNLATYRGYDGATGRFINRDPIRERGGINIYAYVGANPLLRIDPNGEFWPEIIAIGLIVIGEVNWIGWALHPDPMPPPAEPGGSCPISGPPVHESEPEQPEPTPDWPEPPIIAPPRISYPAPGWGGGGPRR